MWIRQFGSPDWKNAVPSRFTGPRRSQSSPLPRCGVVGGRPGAAGPSSRHGRARTAGRGASRSVRHRRSLMPCSMLWTTSRERVSHQLRLAHRRAPYRSSSSFVARSMPSWSSATTSGITRHGFSSSRKPAAVSPIEPEDARAIEVAACTRTPACTVSYSLRFTTQRVSDPRAGATADQGIHTDDARTGGDSVASEREARLWRPPRPARARRYCSGPRTPSWMLPVPATLSQWVISCRPIRPSPELRPLCVRSGSATRPPSPSPAGIPTYPGSR